MGVVLTAWYADRASGLLAFAALYAAVVTGVAYRAKSFGRFHAFALDYHLDIAALAVFLGAIHGVVGAIDAIFLGVGLAPAPSYSMWWFAGGVVAGLLAAWLLVVAVLGFLDPGRYAWSPLVVHALAYAGFVVAAVHVVAVGSDVGVIGRIAVLSVVGLLAVALGKRYTAETTAGV